MGKYLQDTPSKFANKIKPCCQTSFLCHSFQTQCYKACGSMAAGRTFSCSIFYFAFLSCMVHLVSQRHFFYNVCQVFLLHGRDGASVLSSPLCFFFHKSFSTGKLPHLWKLANITPLFKKGNKTDRNNYRQISLTSVVCKITEKIVKSRVMDFWQNINIFT